MDISGKTFLVTGAASGLGQATARMFVARGANVLMADMNAAGEAAARELGFHAHYVITDVTKEKDGTAAVSAAREKFGALHGLVNCAGIAPTERVAGREGPHKLESFARAININLVGTFNMMRLAVDAMKDNEPMADGERGVIINTASVAAFEGQIGQVAYSASKAGVAGMTLPAARELARFGIRVMTIAPGLFMTPMIAGFSEAVQQALAQTTVFPTRLGKPEEYAALVASICESVMLNGEVIRLDGAIRLTSK